MKLIKFLKKKILLIIVVAFFFGTAGIYAGSATTASGVNFDRTKSGFSSTNVQGALDTLYNKVNNPVTVTVAAINSSAVSVNAGYYNKADVLGVFNLGVANGKTTHTGTKVLASTDIAVTSLGDYHSYRYINARAVYDAGYAKGVASSPKVIKTDFKFGSEYRDTIYFDWICPSTGTLQVLNMNAYITNQCSGSDGDIHFYIGSNHIINMDVRDGCDDYTANLPDTSGSWRCNAGERVYGRVWVGGGIEQYSQIYGEVHVSGIFYPDL